MNWADFAILAIIALSAIIGFFRGFLREVIGLVTWALAFYLAFISAQAISGWFEAWISSSSIRIGVAFAVIFLAVLIVGAVFNFIIGRLVNKTGFAGTDRTVGGAFGILRGAAILVLLALLAGMTPLPRDAWWQESVLISHLQDGAIYVRDMLPERFAQAIVYPSDSTMIKPSSVVTDLPVETPPMDDKNAIQSSEVP